LHGDDRYVPGEFLRARTGRIKQPQENTLPKNFLMLTAIKSPYGFVANSTRVRVSTECHTAKNIEPETCRNTLHRGAIVILLVRRLTSSATSLFAQGARKIAEQEQIADRDRDYPQGRAVWFLRGRAGPLDPQLQP